ncbi:uncharacterized protein LOC113235660 [Hyposmocoma kahamanoa]|uniref:uncharacterized protein LOC113235660 n=1 Tax=Hyposmocoma kahamanoa TaxID=1477025 RepID=UPI000E6D6C2A|nr:uncharacterized protein LOC113235660 [Hyposmocoma kahamanoa]
MVLNVIRVAARISNSCALSQCCRRAAYSTDSKVRLYTKKHEWVSVSNDIGTIGISNYAQDALGEVVFAQLPDVGKQVAAGDDCAALESVKAASEVYTPVSGVVTEKNTSVESTPSIINQSCYGEGWLFKVKLTKPEELNNLLDQTAYDKYVEESH